MSGVGPVRWGLGGLGVALAAYGGWLWLSRQDAAQTWSAVQYLVAGVVLHDAVLGAALLVAGVLVTRVLPAPARAPVVVGGVVLGSVTLWAVPVLLSYGRRPDNPTLLDRDFTAGWLGFAALVLALVALAVVRRLRAAREAAARAGEG